MVIGFETLKLRTLCEEEAAAVNELGKSAWHLHTSLADLASAPTLADLPPGMATLRDETLYQFVVESGPIQLIFVPNHKKIPLDKAGQLDLDKVMRVKVVEIQHHA